MIIRKITGKFFSVYVFFLTAFGLTECLAYNVIGTGPKGSSYEQTGQKISEVLGRNSLIESSGSATNLRGLYNGEFTVAIAQSDVASCAYQGTGTFERIGKFSNLRTIGTAYLEYIYLVVPADSTIKSVKDLQGKHLNMGLPGSGTLTTATTVLSAQGLKSSQYMPHYLGFKNLDKQFKQGKVDAAFIVDKLPSEQLVELSRRIPIRLIPIQLSDMNNMTPAYIHYRQSSIPGKIYNISQNTPTLAVEAQVFATTAMSPKTAFKIAETLKENADPDIKELNSKELVELNYPPLHAGAADFYRRNNFG